MKRTNRKDSRRPRRAKKKTARPIRIELGFAPRKPSELEIQAKKAIMALLAQAEENPEKVLNGMSKAAELAAETRKFIKEHPKEARTVASQAALSLLAGFARRSLGK